MDNFTKHPKSFHVQEGQIILSKAPVLHHHAGDACFLRCFHKLPGIIDGESCRNLTAALEHEAALGVAHHRVPRVSTASLAPTGRATCRGCKEVIAKDTWRIALLFYEDGRFVPSGFVHASCASSYLETLELLPRIRHFSPDLSEADIAALAAALS